MPQTVTQSGTTKATYGWFADGSKYSVQDAQGNGYYYIGSLIYSSTAGTTALESTDFSGGRIVLSGNTQTIHYHHKDHLGSVRAITDGSGSTIEQNAYYPFGGRHTFGQTYAQTSANRYKFNGKELQTTGNLSLLDYGARMYDTKTARWLVQDPLAEKYYPFSAYNYCVNNPVIYVDPDGMVVRIYVQSGIIGHTFVTTGEGASTTVYSYGRYGEIYPISSGITMGRYTPIGEGVLLKGSGKQAMNYLQEIKEKSKVSIFEIPRADEAKVDSYFNELFNNGKTQESIRTELDSKIIDEYSLLTNNCTTISIDAVNYASGNIPSSSSIIVMPYDQTLTFNINIIKPSQLKNQLNSDRNVVRVEDPYNFLINLINNLNTTKE